MPEAIGLPLRPKIRRPRRASQTVGLSSGEFDWCARSYVHHLAVAVLGTGKLALDPLRRLGQHPAKARTRRKQASALGKMRTTGQILAVEMANREPRVTAPLAPEVSRAAEIVYARHTALPNTGPEQTRPVIGIFSSFCFTTE